MLKKLLCLLLALMMVVSLMACDSDSGKDNDDDDDEEIVDEKDKDEEEEEEEESTTTEPELTLAEKLLGTWVIEVELTDELLGVEGFDTDVSLPMTITFYDDGTLIMGWDEDALEDRIVDLEEDLIDYMCEIMYTSMEESGYSREETDEAFEAAYGFTVRDYCAEYVEAMDLASSMMGAESELEYELDGDILVVDSEEIVIEIEDDTLTFVETNMPDSWESMGISMPAEWTRIG